MQRHISLIKAKQTTKRHTDSLRGVHTLLK